MFAQHHGAVYRYLARFTGDADLAADLAQETFVRLAEHPPPDHERLKGWLFTVATNLARDAMRTNRRRLRLLDRSGDRVPLADPPPDPAALAVRAEEVARVREALNALTERDRTMLLMREEGFTHQEIAAAAGTTTKSVGTMVARALNRLAEQLDLGRGGVEST